MYRLKNPWKSSYEKFPKFFFKTFPPHISGGILGRIIWRIFGEISRENFGIMPGRIVKRILEWELGSTLGGILRKIIINYSKKKLKAELLK